jgi:hypothetical protein
MDPPLSLLAWLSGRAEGKEWSEFVAQFLPLLRIIGYLGRAISIWFNMKTPFWKEIRRARVEFDSSSKFNEIIVVVSLGYGDGCEVTKVLAFS